MYFILLWCDIMNNCKAIPIYSREIRLSISEYSEQRQLLSLFRTLANTRHLRTEPYIETVLDTGLWGQYYYHY